MLARFPALSARVDVDLIGHPVLERRPRPGGRAVGPVRAGQINLGGPPDRRLVLIKSVGARVPPDVVEGPRGNGDPDLGGSRGQRRRIGNRAGGQENLERGFRVIRIIRRHGPMDRGRRRGVVEIHRELGHGGLDVAHFIGGTGEDVIAIVVIEGQRLVPGVPGIGPGPAGVPHEGRLVPERHRGVRPVSAPAVPIRPRRGIGGDADVYLVDARQIAQDRAGDRTDVVGEGGVDRPSEGGGRSGRVHDEGDD